ncbi:hypothetical protein MNL33_16125 [Acinetobacter baumannii]|uniref:hypothetical protein n=1 Tax=Acinetobacter baumannii TaxID=470 RepID=UPI001FAD2A28|nr:hypothetical protein [Acinetobacter baumannii]MCJ0773015.1 hypothetical protein [Acinetobacter baumannii]
MALKVGIIKSSDVSKWCEYKGADGDVQAEFKVRGIAYKPFQVAIERAEVVDGKTIESEKPYTPENASKLLNLGDIGISIWLFIKEQAQKIQEDADKDKALILGKSSSSISTKRPIRQKRRTKSNKSSS